jgi:hypothetical protein
MDPFFKKSDFVLCEVPVPKGYKQSQTHAGVAYYEGNVYLTTSPYPSNIKPLWMLYIMAAVRKLTFGHLFKPFIAEQWENPCIYIGDSNKDSFPIHFKLLKDDPLMPLPVSENGLPAYNSDPDLFIDNKTINVLNRSVFREVQSDGVHPYKYVTRIFLIQGLFDNGQFVIQETKLLFETHRNVISPCLINYHEEYIMTELETYSYNDGESFDGLYLTRSNTIDSIGRGQKWEVVEIDSGNYLPWHMSLFKEGDHLYAIVACVKRGEKQRCWQMLGVFSDDLKRLHIYQKPLTDYKSYRSSALIMNEQFVLYNTVVHEKVKGSKSVDGRDIIMAYTGFEHLLDTLKEAESQ